MATAKKSKKTAKRLRKSTKLEEQKPLSKLDAPTESLSFPYGSIQIK
jgi:hypothetical protein